MTLGRRAGEVGLLHCSIRSPSVAQPSQSPSGPGGRWPRSRAVSASVRRGRVMDRSPGTGGRPTCGVDGPSCACCRPRSPRPAAMPRAKSSAATTTSRLCRLAVQFAIQAVPSSPVSGATEPYMLFLLAIDSARESIALTSPYFVPDDGMARALAGAAERGVERGGVERRSPDARRQSRLLPTGAQGRRQDLRVPAGQVFPDFGGRTPPERGEGCDQDWSVVWGCFSFSSCQRSWSRSHPKDHRKPPRV